VRDNAHHILIVIASLGGGGAERVVTDFSGYLVEKGREVTVLTTNGDDRDAYTLPREVCRKRIDIRRPAQWWLDSLRFALNSLWNIRRQIKAINPDVIVSFIDQTNIRVLTAAAGTGVPVIVSERTHPGHHSLQAHWEWARRLTYRMAAAVVVQTDAAASWFRANVETRKLCIIPNAVRREAGGRMRREEVALNEVNSITAVGRLVPEKGFDLLISAFAGSGLADMGWNLIFLGEGPERAKLKVQAQELGIADSLILPGRVGDVANWLCRTSIFALSSRYEGFPNALLEAMQLGVPSISFDCPSGPADIISNGRNGLLVPGEDTVSLAAALHRLGTDADLRKTFSTEAVRVNDRFSPDRVYNQWTDAIDGAFRRKSISAGYAKHRSL
jgi:glycosyltransferase involved in cell wall biosynthesis